ncbi:MAG: glycine cleavage system protein GcvH [Candidatus Bathyarchaeota archaeon]|nr:glycine cleavage system protein GcvH [Candidatus Bathyarchaeota archaeon]
MTKNPLMIKVDKWTFHVPTDRVYNENDCWAKFDDVITTIGITDFLQNMIGDIVFVELPEIGSRVEQFGEVGSFEGMKAVLDLISPVSGVVKKVNEELNEKPELLNQDPYGKGWFVEVEAVDFETEKEFLLGPHAYFEVMKRKIEQERVKLIR